MFANQIGEKIAAARKSRNLSQTDLAKYVSMSPQMVSKWERGESLPDVIMLKTLSEILQVDINYFYSDTVNGSSDTPNFETEYCQPAKKPKRPIFKYTNWDSSDFSKSTLRAKNFDFSNFINCDLSGSDLSESSFSFTAVNKSNFSEAILNNSFLKAADFKQSPFKGVKFAGAAISMSNFTKCDMSNIQLINTELRSSSFNDCTFENLYAEESSFTACGIINCKIFGATLTNTPFKNCKFKNAEFENCKMDKISYNFLQNSRGVKIENIEIIG